MKQIAAYQTSDGAVHMTKNRALSHAENRFGDALCKLARDIISTDCKYSSVLGLLETKLGEMQQIIDLAHDRTIEAEED